MSDDEPTVPDGTDFASRVYSDRSSAVRNKSDQESRGYLVPQAEDRAKANPQPPEAA